ncbi:MAG: hypothetical protein JJU28_12285 [Cyclobacteriaceae bacterium]|nr:hypothetical protein [Cyclobacteriaceae bacterium]
MKDHIYSSFYLIQKYSIIIILCFVNTGWLQAQDDTFIREGENIEGEVIIRKDLKIELPPAERNYEPIAPQAGDLNTGMPLQYRTRDFPVIMEDLVTRMRVLKIKSDESIDRPGSYLKGGFGNYATPFFKGYLGMGKNPDANVNLKLGHISSARGPVDKGNSADAHSIVDLNGKFSANKLKIGAHTTYMRDMYHFYGYTPGLEVDRDTIQQIYQTMDAGFDFQTLNLGSPVRLYGAMNFTNTQDRFDVNENNILIKGGLDFDLSDEITASIDVSSLVSRFQKESSRINRNLLRITPGLRYLTDDFELSGGFRFVYNTDTLDVSKRTSLFPVLNAQYFMSDQITAYAGLNGDVEAVTLQHLSRENPFLMPGASMAHTRKFELLGGVRGRLLKSLGFDAGFALGTFNHLYFYQLDTERNNQFTLLFDDQSTGFYRFHTSLSYSIQEIGGVAADIQYISYNTKGLAEPWHRPAFSGSFSGWYNLFDKIMLKTDVLTLSGIKAQDPLTMEVKSLKAAVDINLQADYRLSERWGAFLMVNNLLTRKYEFFLNYPVRSLMVIGGLTIEF